MCFSVYTQYTDESNVFPDVHQLTSDSEQRDSLIENPLLIALEYL